MRPLSSTVIQAYCKRINFANSELHSLNIRSVSLVALANSLGDAQKPAHFRTLHLKEGVDLVLAVFGQPCLRMTAFHDLDGV